MKTKEIYGLIKEGENYQCEFKRKFTTPKKIAKEMIAFANSGGGYILFGVDDDKKIIGVDSEKSEAEFIKDAADNYCEPAIEYNLQYKEIDSKEVIIVQISESNQKPHRLQDYKNTIDINNAEVAVRVNDKSVLASKEMIKIMIKESSGENLKFYSIGPNEKKVFDFLERNETITVNQLKQEINISERRASRTLIKMVIAKLLVLHKKDNGEEYFSAY